MVNPTGYNEQRRDPRIESELPVMIRVGSQITVQGQLKDLSLNSAFIKIKSSVFLKTGDEIGFVIQPSAHDADTLIQGLACISRIVPGEGFAIYFSKIDDNSSKCLKKLLQKSVTDFKTP